MSAVPPFRYASVCAGIEAATVAWHGLGWQAAFFSEIDKAPLKVLAHHYPDVPRHGDFTTVKGNEYGPVDLLAGGTPCQSFSVAGKRLGLDDPRGNLALEYLRFALRLNTRWFTFENVPGLLSSAGGDDFAAFLSAATGTAIKPPPTGWGNAGIARGITGRYGLAWRILDAQYFGVPQRRRRVFVIGYLGDWRPAAAVLFERESMRGYITPRRETGKRTAGTIARCSFSGGAGGKPEGAAAGHFVTEPSDGSGLPLPKVPGSEQRDVVADLRMVRARADGEGARPETITMAHGQGNAEIAINHAPTLSCNHEAPILAHSLRGEGFDASEDGTGRGIPLVPIAWDEEINASENISGAIIRGGDGGRHAGVAVPVTFPADMSGTQRGYAEDRAELHRTRGSQAVAFSCKDYGNDASHDLSPTLRSMGHDKSHPNSGGQIAIAIQERAMCENPDAGPDGAGIRADDTAFTLEARTVPQSVCFPINTQVGLRHEALGEGTGLGIGKPDDPGYTLQAGHGHAVAFAQNQTGELRTGAVSNTLNTNTNASGRNTAMAMQGMTVRRLTPRECERLQGFPDDYTLIPGPILPHVRREKLDQDYIKYLARGGRLTFEQCMNATADGPRYKMLGNSMAVPVMAWIGQRIAAVDKICAEINKQKEFA